MQTVNTKKEQVTAHVRRWQVSSEGRARPRQLQRRHRHTGSSSKLWTGGGRTQGGDEEQGLLGMAPQVEGWGAACACATWQQ